MTATYLSPVIINVKHQHGRSDLSEKLNKEACNVNLVKCKMTHGSDNQNHKPNAVFLNKQKKAIMHYQVKFS